MKQNIAFIITGSIACYKSLDIIRSLIKKNINITPILTQTASQFLSTDLVSALAQNPCHSHNSHQMEHIKLAREADIIVVCPATANFINTIAQGFTNNLASEVILSKSPEVPVIICPAMNKEMYNNPITQKSLQILQELPNFSLINPREGTLACGEEGIGKLAQPEDIEHTILRTLQNPKNQTQQEPLNILITLGRTIEKIDPARYISNFSTGKQGVEVAKACINQGHKVTIISGKRDVPIPIGTHKTIESHSHKEMREAVLQETPSQHIFISVAAVSDYSPETYHPQKMKKSSTSLTLQLKQNSDILKEVCHSPNKPAIVIGFAAETNNPLENGKKKLETKGCDFIFVNNLCFGVQDTNGILIDTQECRVNFTDFSGSKFSLATLLLSKAIPAYKAKISKKL